MCAMWVTFELWHEPADPQPSESNIAEIHAFKTASLVPGQGQDPLYKTAESTSDKDQIRAKQETNLTLFVLGTDSLRSC